MENISAILGGFDGLRVLVVGDLMVDEHVWGTASRVSPEAPVLVVDAAGDPELLPGGAANVVNNIRALGGSAAIIGVVGDDNYGRELDRHLMSAGVDTSGLVVDDERMTTRKTRIWVSHRQQVARVDWESRHRVSVSIEDQLIERIQSEIAISDALILSDYNKGVLTPRVAKEAIRLASECGKLCAVNPKPMNISNFNGAGLIVLNHSEAQAAAGVMLDREETIISAGTKMRQDLNVGCLVITRGSVGLSVFDESGFRTIRAIPTEVYDVAGAGDTVISSITLSFAAGANAFDAAAIGNFAGGASVRKVGVAAVTREDILATCKS